MKKKDNLFSLIKTLTKNEKRYFKIHASSHIIGSSNNYTLLFDAISKQNSYDETEIKKSLKHIIPPKHFRVVKKYLYEMILKSLHFYHSEDTVGMRLKKLVQCVEILFNKTLYEQCETLLAKGEKTALTFDKFDILIEIYSWRSKIILAQSFKGIQKRDINKLYENECVVIEKLKREVRYKYLNASLFFQLKQTKFIRSNKENVKQYDSLINDTLLLDENSADSIQSKYFYYSTLGSYYQIAGKPETGQLYYNKQLAFFEKYPELINEYFDNYLAILSNLVVSLTETKKFNEALFLLDKLGEIKTKMLRYEVRKFVLIYSRKIEILLNTGQFEKAQEIIPDIEEGMQKYSGKISVLHLFTFDFNMACLYIILGEHKKALESLNKIINFPVLNMGIDIQSFARILNLIVHYELGNWEHLPYIIRSIYRFLMKKERFFKFEKILIRYMNKLPMKINEASLKKWFYDFKQEISPLANDAYESIVFQHFDFISWAESKIENRPFVDVMREKVRVR